MQVFISSIDRTVNFLAGSLEIEDTINDRSTARLRLVDKTKTLNFVDGQPITIYDGATLIFGGYLLFPKKFVPIHGNAFFFDVECVDQHQIADRFLVAKTYINTSVRDIAQDLWSTYLQADGVTIGTLDTYLSTVILERASFPRVGTVTDAMNELSEITGCQWYIDYDKKLYFTQRTFFSAPFSITSTSSIVNVNVRQDRSQYRNRQYIRGGLSATSTITLEAPTPSPDSVSRTFLTRFPLAEKPSIFINSIQVPANDIGINGIDSGKKFYYLYDSNAVTQDTSQTVLTASDNIRITYKGLVALAVVAEDPVAIADRVAVEGGTGVYERIDVDQAISSRDEALDVANGKLTKYTKILREITYDTFTGGIAAGQLQNINLPNYNINSSDFLIDRVNISELDDSGKLIYSVHAIDGETFGGWIKFYRDLLRSNLKASIRENELLVVLSTTYEFEGWAENVNINIFSCPIPSDTLFPSETLYPC